MQATFSTAIPSGLRDPCCAESRLLTAVAARKQHGLTPAANGPGTTYASRLPVAGSLGSPGFWFPRDL
jgi:hypothetical protein